MPTFNDIAKHWTKTDMLKHYQELAIEAQIDVEMRTLAITLDPALHHALVDYSADNGITRETAIKEMIKSYLSK